MANGGDLYRMTGIGEICVDVRTNYVCPFHTHDTYSIGIFRGPARIVCRGAAWDVDSGDILMLEPDEPHRGTPLSSACGQDGVLPDAAFMTDTFGSPQPFRIPRSVVQDPALADELSDAAAGRRSPHLRMLLRRLFELYGEPGLPTARANAGPSESALRAALAGGVAAASEAHGLSRWRFGRKLRDETGLTPRDMRRQLRVAEARGLIEQGETLAEAAFGAGFSDQAHMSRQLRSLLGVTPAALRRSGV